MKPKTKEKDKGKKKASLLWINYSLFVCSTVQLTILVEVF